MSGRPILTVVIPTHETRELVLMCLESLHIGSLSHPEMEIIVVDDGSSDGSAEEIRRRYPRLSILSHHRAEGFSKAATHGLDRASGSFLLLLNSDTRMPPGSLDALLERFEKHPEKEIIGGRLLDPDGSPQWSGGPFPTLPWLFALISGIGALRARLMGKRSIREDPSTGACRIDWVSGAAMAFRREVWDQLRPLDDGFAFYAQDLDFCYRANSTGIPSILLPGFRVIHEHGGTVRSQPGAVARVEPEKLWPDLLRFVAMNRSPSVYRLTGRVMLLAAGLRLAARSVAACFKTGESRRRWQGDTQRFRRAAAELSRNAASP